MRSRSAFVLAKGTYEPSSGKNICVPPIAALRKFQPAVVASGEVAFVDQQVGKLLDELDLREVRARQRRAAPAVAEPRSS